MKTKYSLSDDITFCNSKCSNKKCFRHPSNMIYPEYGKFYYYGDFKGSQYCPSYLKDMRGDKGAR